MEAYHRRTGQTAADAGVAARRAIAITHGGVEAAERIRARPGLDAAGRESRGDS